MVFVGLIEGFGVPVAAAKATVELEIGVDGEDVPDALFPLQAASIPAITRMLNGTQKRFALRCNCKIQPPSFVHRLKLLQKLAFSVYTDKLPCVLLMPYYVRGEEMKQAREV